MKKQLLYLLLSGISIVSLPLHADIRSFTNADLNPNVTTVGGNSNTPNASTNQSTPGQTPNATTPGSKYPPLSPSQEQQILSQMNAQIQTAEQRVQNQMDLVQDHTRMPMSFDKVVLEQAIMDLEVKKTLVGKFQNSPSLRSPRVQQVLMGILSKEGISAADLANLQSVTDAERPYTYP